MAEISARGVKYCPRSLSAFLRGLFYQPFVCVALEVGVVAHPLVLVDELLDELFQLGRILDSVSGLAEHHAEHVVVRPEFGKGLVVLGFELLARPVQQGLPVVANGHDALPQQLLLLIGHLQEQQVGELFQVVAVGQPVVAEHVAEIPELLHHGFGIGGHRGFTVSECSTRFQLAVARQHSGALPSSWSQYRWLGMYDSYMTEVAVSEARNRLAEVIDEARRSGEPISVTRRGRRVAVILDSDAFDRLVDIAEDIEDRRELDAGRADDDYVPWEEVKAALGLE